MKRWTRSRGGYAATAKIDLANLPKVPAGPGQGASVKAACATSPCPTCGAIRMEET